MLNMPMRGVQEPWGPGRNYFPKAEVIKEVEQLRGEVKNFAAKVKGLEAELEKEVVVKVKLQKRST